MVSGPYSYWEGPKSVGPSEKEGIPDKTLPWQHSRRMEAVAKSATKASCAFKTQLDLFIGKELHVGISQGKEGKEVQ